MSRKLILFSLFALVWVGAISASAWHDPFVLDDSHSIVNNPDIRSLRDLPRKLVFPPAANHDLNRNDPSRPLVYATYALNYAESGLKPEPYRAVNLFFHLLNGILVFWIATGVLAGLREKNSKFVPAITALAFLGTPVNLGTAIYVYGRADVLAGTFALLACGCWLSWLRSQRRLALAGVFGGLTLGLLCNQAIVMLPALLVALEWIMISPSSKKSFQGFKWTRTHSALIAVAAGYVLLRALLLGGIGDLNAQGHWDPTDYLLVMPKVIWKYWQLLLVPWGFSIDHFVQPLEDAVELILPLGLLLMVGFYFWYNRRRLSDSTIRLRLFSVAWFLICLAPTSSIFPTVDALVERRVYLASFGFYLLLAWELGRRCKDKKSNLIWLPAGFLLAAFAGGSLYRGHVQGDDLRLWSYVFERYPENPRVWFKLGLARFKRHEYALALPLFEQTVKAVPRHYVAWIDLGLLYRAPDNPARDPSRSLAAIQHAVEANPDYAPAHFELARTYLELGEREKAKQELSISLGLSPEDTEAIELQRRLLLSP